MHLVALVDASGVSKARSGDEQASLGVDAGLFAYGRPHFSFGQKIGITDHAPFPGVIDDLLQQLRKPFAAPLGGVECGVDADERWVLRG